MSKIEYIIDDQLYTKDIQILYIKNNQISFLIWNNMPNIKKCYIYHNNIKYICDIKEFKLITSIASISK